MFSLQLQIIMDGAYGCSSDQPAKVGRSLSAMNERTPTHVM